MKSLERAVTYPSQLFRIQSTAFPNSCYRVTSSWNGCNITKYIRNYSL